MEKEEKIELEQSNVNINDIPVVEEATNEEVKEEATSEEAVKEAIVEEVKQPTYNELRKLAKSKGLTFAKNASKEELIKILNASEIVNADVISLDNKPVSPIVISNDEEVIHEAFIATAPKRNLKTNVRGTHNGRVYKVINNGYGIWCDNGQSFDLATIK
jgi:hypothetical protein